MYTLSLFNCSTQLMHCWVEIAVKRHHLHTSTQFHRFFIDKVAGVRSTTSNARLRLLRQIFPLRRSITSSRRLVVMSLQRFVHCLTKPLHSTRFRQHILTGSWVSSLRVSPAFSTSHCWAAAFLTYSMPPTGWPKKVSHYRESSLNRNKNRQPG